MKTVIQALLDEVFYPIPRGKAENICIRRGLNGEEPFNAERASSNAYKGALADCLYSLIQAITFSEAGMSVGALTDAQRKAILKQMNGLYDEIGEEPKDDGATPTVYINC